MSTLERRLGTGRAVVIGLAAMLGAGVFFVWAPAASVAGTGLFIGLAIASVVATLNALSTAQLATALPVSGGAYAYGRRYLNPWVGFSAGVLFLTGKTASVSAIALVAGSYLWPEHARWVAAAAILLLAAVNATGIRSTAAVSAVIVAIVLTGIVASLGLALPSVQPIRMEAMAGPLGILQSAGLLFFAFAGYARLATLGAEVRDPRRTLPRAIIIALSTTLVLYALVATTLVSVVGVERLATSTSPFAELGVAEPLVRGIAVLACLGSLLGLLAGLSRTGLAMAQQRDLPGPLAHISPRTKAPVVAEFVFALVGVAAVLLLDPAWLIGVSSAAVLAYYGVAHLAALRQPAGERWVPRALSALGLVGCAVLVVTLPWQGVAVAAAVLLVSLVARRVRA